MTTDDMYYGKYKVLEDVNSGVLALMDEDDLVYSEEPMWIMVDKVIIEPYKLVERSIEARTDPAFSLIQYKKYYFRLHSFLNKDDSWEVSGRGEWFLEAGEHSDNPVKLMMAMAAGTCETQLVSGMYDDAVVTKLRELAAVTKKQSKLTPKEL